MINQNLHKQPVPLDSVKHRNLKLDVDARNMANVAALNAFFVAGTEFGDAVKDYPVVFVNAGTDESGKPAVAPIAVFGLQAGQNLCLDDSGEVWRVRYVPAALRLYPFGLARVQPDQMVMCFDESWSGFSQTQGRELFTADGKPTEFTLEVQKQLEAFETEIERTRLVCELLRDKGLLRDMRFDATLPDGQTLTVDGFLTIDSDKLNALPDADVLALHKNGVMGLIHAHQLSLGNMSKLVEWHVARLPQAPAA